MPYDVLVIGGGPAGMSAAINTASEGLDTMLVAERLGGQAGTSSLIENVLGFPNGISGPALMNRAYRQGLKFGVHFVKNCVKSVKNTGECFTVTLANGTLVRTRSIIVAAGVHYNKLEVAVPFEGKGTHYSCTQTTVRRSCQCDEVGVIGAGNSAGQAAMFLSTKARHVHMIVRGKSLGATMSSYLHTRILACENISVHLNVNVTDIVGHDDRIDVAELDNGDTLNISDLYVMTGASPNTEFLSGLCDCEKGFIRTDGNFQTRTPGIFAVGDVRLGSVKRVSNAVGEGAACVPKVWEFLNHV